jgi:hypothetical protein
LEPRDAGAIVTLLQELEPDATLGRVGLEEISERFLGREVQ